MELVFNHKIYYSNEKPIPISQVAESLLALDRIIQRTPSALEKVFPGTKIKKVLVYVDNIESGSISETFLVKFLFGSQENFEDFLNKMRERLGMEKLAEKPILAALILALIFSGGAIANHYWGSSPEQKALIEANNNTIINIGSEMVSMKPDDYKKIIVDAINNKADLAKDAIKVIRPAKSDPKASIVFDGHQELSISPDVIRAIPTYLQDDISDESINDFDKVEILIRAIDLDSFKRGWAVVIPDVSEKRIPLQIDKKIDPERLLGLKFFTGDVTVIFQKDNSGKDVPQKAFLRKLYPAPE